MTVERISIKRLAVLVAVLAAGLAIALLSHGASPRRHIRPHAAKSAAAVTPRCTEVLDSADDIAQAIGSAHNGDAICLGTGSYPAIDVSHVQHTSYVTVEPAPGATVAVDGVQTDSDTFLRFQGLNLTAGVNMIGPGAASHDLQFVDNNVGHTTYGFVINGTDAPIRNVLIEGNAIHDLDFSGPSAGYAGGQGITVYFGADIVVSDNRFWANSWHYIQCGTCDDMVVDHNMFTGPSNMHAGAHLNVWQIWAGSADDSFSNNEVIGSPDAPIAAGAILWESGPGGATLSDGYTHMTISNNLFVDEDSATTVDVAGATGLTVTNNTIVGSTFGLLIRGRCTCAAGLDTPGTGYNISNNIVVRDASDGARFRVFCPDSGFCGDGNVSDDDSARTAFPGSLHSVTNWIPRWTSTAWSPGNGEPSSGFYRPVGLPSSVGYQPR